MYFVARRNPSGVITKSWRYIAAGYDITLGTSPLHSLEDARQWHCQQVAKVKRGLTPNKADSGTPVEMSAFFKEWLQVKCPEPSRPNRASIRNKHCKPLHNLAPDKLTYQNVYTLLLTLGPTNAAHRVCQITRAMMLYAFQVHGIEGQPGQPVYVPQKLSEVYDRKIVASVTGKVRENCLNKEQYHTLWYSLGDSPSHAAMRFLMVTGARKSEVTEMVWAKLDLKSRAWTVPANKTKTPIIAADLLNDRVLPFYESNGLPMLGLLTDRGTEFCGKVNSMIIRFIW